MIVVNRILIISLILIVQLFGQEAQLSTYDSVEIEQPGFRMAIDIHVPEHSDSDYEAQEVLAQKKAYAPILKNNGEWVQQAANHFLNGKHKYKRFHKILKKDFLYKEEMGFKGIYRSFPLQIPLLRPKVFMDSNFQFSVPYPSSLEVAFYMEPDNHDKYELVESLFWGSQINNMAFQKELVLQTDLLEKEKFIEKVKSFIRSPDSVGARISYQFPVMFKHKDKLEKYSESKSFEDKEKAFLRIWNQFLSGKSINLDVLGYKERHLLPLAHVLLDDDEFEKFKTRKMNDD